MIVKSLCPQWTVREPWNSVVQYPATHRTVRDVLALNLCDFELKYKNDMKFCLPLR